MILQEKSGMVHYIKMWNMRNIMLLLLSNGEMTKQELLEQTCLSASTISDCVSKLLGLGVVCEAGREESSGGRRAAIYQIAPSYGAFVGIVVQDAAISFALCDMQGKLRDTWEEPLSSHPAALYALYQGIERGIAISPNRILALGLGLRDKTNAEKGIVLENALLGWQNVHIKEILERRYGIYTHLDHPVNCGALEQQVFGQGRHIANFMCAYPQYSEKVALVLEGRAVRGTENTCGILKQKMELSTLRELAAFLSITHVFLGVRDGCTQDVPDSIFHCFHTPAQYFERCTALMAQLHWFEKIYDLIHGGAQ